MRNNFNTLSSQEETSVSYKKKIAAATLAITGLISAGCSSEGSASGGGLFNSSREVITGEECASRTDIHNIGTFSPVEYDASDEWGYSRPAPDLVLNREGIAFRDGLASERQGPTGTLVDMDTLTSEQNAQLDASYALGVEQYVAKTDISLEEFQYGSPASMPRFSNGYIVAYGKDLTDDFRPLDENKWRYTDGEIDSSELQLCAFIEGGLVTQDQFIR